MDLVFVLFCSESKVIYLFISPQITVDLICFILLDFFDFVLFCSLSKVILLVLLCPQSDVDLFGSTGLYLFDFYSQSKVNVLVLFCPLSPVDLFSFVFPTECSRFVLFCTQRTVDLVCFVLLDFLLL